MPPISAADFFRAKLDFETDPADLAADRAAGSGPLVVDTRSVEAWRQGRIPGAVHIPTAELAVRIAEVASDEETPIVVYCWGPGCNGSTRAALLLTSLGYRSVRELVGGFEYWAREGFATVSDEGRSRRAPDPLTAPALLPRRPDGASAAVIAAARAHPGRPRDAGPAAADRVRR